MYTMNELKILLQENLNKEFISATLSAPRQKEGITKVKVRPLLKKGELVFQLESFKNNQAFHENLEANETMERILEYMNNMKQMQFETSQWNYMVLVSKKGKLTIKRKAQKEQNKKQSFLITGRSSIFWRKVYLFRFCGIWEL